MFTAQCAIQAVNSNKGVTPQQVEQLLANVKGTTFANVTYATKVATAAAHKAMNIQKVTKASVQLFNSLNEFTDVYTNAVKRTAAQYENNEATGEQFVKSDNYFEHTPCFSVVKHKTADKFYLYAIYNNAESYYVLDNTVITTQDVAQYLTPSAKDALLNPTDTVYNVRNDVTHSVTVRTVSLDNVLSLTAMKQTLMA